MRAVPVTAPPSVETTKATGPAEADRRTLTVDQVRDRIRDDHKLPRRRAAWLAGQCLKSEAVAGMYLPAVMVADLHGPDVRTRPELTFTRRAPRMVGTGETGRLDRAGVTAR